MFLFLRLLLAHFIADFPFQTGKIFDLKTRNFLGTILHSFIFFVLALLFSVPYLNEFSVWITILGLSVSHCIIDWLKLKITEATDTNNIFAFLLDQAAHIFLITTVLLIPAGKIPILLPASWFGNIYNDDKFIIYLIGLILSTYGASFILYYIKATFIDRKIQYKRDWDGMLERGTVTLLFLLGPKLILITPFVVAARILYYLSVSGHLKNWLDITRRIEPSVEYQKVKLKGYLSVDLAGSPLLAIIIGMILRTF